MAARVFHRASSLGGAAQSRWPAGIRSSLTIAVAGAWLFLGHASDAPPSGEYQLKAAVLCSLPKFVDWPTNRPPAPETAFVIGVLGNDPFGATLDREARASRVQGRTMVIRRLAAEDDPQACHVLFISRSESDRLTNLLARLERKGVLTVSETPGFAERGGMVNMVMKDDMVRFEINLQVATREGIGISSKILKYATVVAPSAPVRPLP